MTFEEAFLTYILLIPYLLLCLYFFLYKKDKFFLKLRASVQLLLILILLALCFCDIVIWKAFFENYTFLNFDIENKLNNAKTTALVTALAAIAAVFGWIFTSRVQIINTVRSHSVQVLMNSRNSTVYMAKVDEATKIRRMLRTEELDVLSFERFEKLEDAEKSSITYLLNFLEFVAIGIRHNNLDEDLIKGSFRTILRSNYNLFLPIIKHTRKLDGDKIYENLELLHKRWDDPNANYNKCIKCDNFSTKVKKYFSLKRTWVLHLLLTSLTGFIWMFIVLVMKSIDRIAIVRSKFICSACMEKDIN